jgi:hypothetical protein
VGDGEVPGLKVRVGVGVRVWCGDAAGEGLGDTSTRTWCWLYGVTYTAPDTGDTAAS